MKNTFFLIFLFLLKISAFSQNCSTLQLSGKYIVSEHLKDGVLQPIFLPEKIDQSGKYTPAIYPACSGYIGNFSLFIERNQYAYQLKAQTFVPEPQKIDTVFVLKTDTIFLQNDIVKYRTEYIYKVTPKKPIFEKGKNLIYHKINLFPKNEIKYNAVSDAAFTSLALGAGFLGGYCWGVGERHLIRTPAYPFPRNQVSHKWRDAGNVAATFGGGTLGVSACLDGELDIRDLLKAAIFSAVTWSGTRIGYYGK